MSSTVCSVLKGTLTFLSPELCKGLAEDESRKNKCLKLSAALQEYEKMDDLRTAFTYLTTAVGDLGVCFECLDERSQHGSPDDDSHDDEHLIFYTPDGSKLEGELRKIKSDEGAKKKFELATRRFRECNEECSKICDNESLIFEDRMTATRARVITEILGNLENLTVAADNSMKIITELHKCQEVISLFIPGHPQQPIKTIWTKFVGYMKNMENKKISSVLHISKGVFNFMKRFLRKPVAILDWPVIKHKQHSPAIVYHPILGQPFRKFYTTMPDLSNSIECNGFAIDATVSAINCTGEILLVAKDNSSMSSSVKPIIMRIADGALHAFWSLNKEAGKQEDSKEELQITSISIDCKDCSLLSQQTNQFHKDCKNKVYVLASYISNEQRLFKMFVIDILGNLQYDIKLTCLPPRNVSDEVCCKILCTQTKVIIFDINKREAYLCDASGELEKPLPNIAKCMPSLATASADEEIVILEKPNKLHFINHISNESSVNTIVMDGCNEVLGMTFNHDLNEVNLLSKASSKEYHFKCYSKVGELQQDIKLREDMQDFWKNATLISHPSGRLVMFDNSRILNLH